MKNNVEGEYLKLKLDKETVTKFSMLYKCKILGAEMGIHHKVEFWISKEAASNAAIWISVGFALGLVLFNLHRVN